MWLLLEKTVIEKIEVVPQRVKSQLFCACVNPPIAIQEPVYYISYVYIPSAV